MLDAPNITNPHVRTNKQGLKRLVQTTPPLRNNMPHRFVFAVDVDEDVGADKGLDERVDGGVRGGTGAGVGTAAFLSIRAGGTNVAKGPD